MWRDPARNSHSNIAKLLQNLDKEIAAAEVFAKQPNANGDLQYIVNTSAACALQQMRRAILESMEGDAALASIAAQNRKEGE